MFSFLKKSKSAGPAQQISPEEYKETTEAMYKQNLEIVRLNKDLDQANKDLEIANKGQENLIHVMNHQIKGYLSKARNIFAELKSEPEYALSEPAKPMVDEGLKSLGEGVEFI